ncbi:Probable peroxidase 61 [Striga hermonthica]|uniref:peroxidase n=1 Tax=Striga hermonthica TaxID=68872 RepID=A0A9N7NMF0_STRHE|nr:Probable peroxidase 61 [Striga hermonthica]
MSRATLDNLRQQCRQTLRNKDPTVFLTSQSGAQYRFTNKYYSNVLSFDSVLGVDQGLLYNYNTFQLAFEYAGSMEKFKRAFALSVTRMSSLKVLRGKQGEIRLNCRYTNNNNPYIN